MRNYRHIEVRPVAGALGAELHGVDISKDLEGDVVSEMRQAFLDHLVIFLRDQKATPRQHLAFARKFGEPLKYPQLDGLPEEPFITAVVKLETERNNFGGLWHSDTTYLPIPPMGSMLLAREVPPYGGDTEFANQYLAYDALSDGLKATLDGLVGVSTSMKAEVSKTREDRRKAAGKENKALEAEHPIVRTHPETGRKALYTSSAHTSHIKGWTERESQALLQFLWEHQSRAEFTCRFRVPGQFPQAYVIAHEIGHHVQNQLGITGKVEQMQQRMSKRDANALSVRVELQADCFAGVWANRADAARGGKMIDDRDVEQALAAASAIGDDRLQRQSQGRVVPDSFTHGSSAQRMRWFRIGLESGDPRKCDTFSAKQL